PVVGRDQGLALEPDPAVQRDRKVLHDDQDVADRCRGLDNRLRRRCRVDPFSHLDPPRTTAGELASGMAICGVPVPSARATQTSVTVASLPGRATAYSSWSSSNHST